LRKNHNQKWKDGEHGGSRHSEGRGEEKHRKNTPFRGSKVYSKERIQEGASCEIINRSEKIASLEGTTHSADAEVSWEKGKSCDLHNYVEQTHRIAQKGGDLHPRKVAVVN